MSASKHLQVEGRLLPRRGPAFVTYLARSVPGFREQAWRHAGLILSAPIRPLLRLLRSRGAPRLEHAFLRGLSHDRLERLGKEYFERVLLPRLATRAVDPDAVLVSGLLDHVVRPLARHLGATRIISNRLEFRDGRATGRLLDPVVRPDEPGTAEPRPVEAAPRRARPPTVVFDRGLAVPRLSVVEALAGREVLVIGATGFIGKVWLAHLLHDLPDLGRIHLLIRPRGATTARMRFEREVLTSPVMRGLDPARVAARVNVVSGEMTQPGLGLAAEDRERLTASLDLVVNSGGVTEFNPDVRLAVTTNVDATMHVLEFVRDCAHARLLHLSTCFVTGRRNGRVAERLEPDYTPTRLRDFSAERELETVRDLIRAEEAETGNLRQRLVRLGMDRAHRLGWPNTYTYTKSLAESLLQHRAGDVAYSIVRPSIVETSTADPFPGWNEGINTSAPLSYLLGTAFRQLPSNARKRLDVVPVDLVSRAMTLIGAALLRGCHFPLFQIATSGSNPCDMRRSIELTGLAHRQHYLAQRGFEPWLRTRLETIPVSKRRYRALSAPGQKAVVRALRRVLPFASSPLRRAERNLDRVEKLIELYEPFIHDNDQVFEAHRIELLSAALPPEERERFAYDHAQIDWSEYWIDIHIPALRRWSYPLLEGRPVT